MKKRLFTCALSVCVATSSMPYAAFAAEDGSGNAVVEGTVSTDGAQPSDEEEGENEENPDTPEQKEGTDGEVQDGETGNEESVDEKQEDKNEESDQKQEDKNEESDEKEEVKENEVIGPQLPENYEMPLLENAPATYADEDADVEAKYVVVLGTAFWKNEADHSQGYTFPQAVVGFTEEDAQQDKITVLTVSASDGGQITNVTAANPEQIGGENTGATLALKDINADGTIKGVTWIFSGNSAITSAKAQELLRKLEFGNYQAGQIVSAVVDGNETTGFDGNVVSNGMTYWSKNEANGTGHYYFHLKETKSWSQAYNRAREFKFGGRQGYLATTATDAEGARLLGLAKDGSTVVPIWVGGTRLLKNDGSKIDNEDIAQTSNSLKYNTTGTGKDAFYWACGPESGQSMASLSWNTGEPNGATDYQNAGSKIGPLSDVAGVESCAMYISDTGKLNDIFEGNREGATLKATAFFVEFGFDDKTDPGTRDEALSSTTSTKEETGGNFAPQEVEAELNGQRYVLSEALTNANENDTITIIKETVTPVKGGVLNNNVTLVTKAGHSYKASNGEPLYIDVDANGNVTLLGETTDPITGDEELAGGRAEVSANAPVKVKYKKNVGGVKQEFEHEFKSSVATTVVMPDDYDSAPYVLFDKSGTIEIGGVTYTVTVPDDNTLVPFYLPDGMNGQHEVTKAEVSGGDSGKEADITVSDTLTITAKPAANGKVTAERTAENSEIIEITMDKTGDGVTIGNTTFTANADGTKLLVPEKKLTNGSITLPGETVEDITINGTKVTTTSGGVTVTKDEGTWTSVDVPAGKDVTVKPYKVEADGTNKDKITVNQKDDENGTTTVRVAKKGDKFTVGGEIYEATEDGQVFILGKDASGKVTAEVANPVVTGKTAYALTFTGVANVEYKIYEKKGNGSYELIENAQLEEVNGGTFSVFRATNLKKGTTYKIDGGKQYGDTEGTTAFVDAADIAAKFDPTGTTTSNNAKDKTEKATNSKVEVTVDDNGNYKVTLIDDVDQTVEVEDTWGDVGIDLNGHDITGPAGEPAISVKASNTANAPGANLTISGNGTIKGGDGTADNANGGDGIKAEDNIKDSKITIGANVTVSGGNGAIGNDGNGGNGGNGISGAIETVVEGTVSGGNGANGADSSTGNGGNAGNGGSGISTSKDATILAGGTVSGGAGGNGGSATGETGNAGNAGNGGSGTNVTNNGKVSNSGTISGGNGGKGGDSKTGNGGAGGNGGNDNIGNNITNNTGASTSAGNGGAGGSSTTGNGGAGGDGGNATLGNGGNGGAGGSSAEGNGGKGGDGGNSTTNKGGDAGNGGSSTNGTAGAGGNAGTGPKGNGAGGTAGTVSYGTLTSTDDSVIVKNPRNNVTYKLYDENFDKVLATKTPQGGGADLVFDGLMPETKYYVMYTDPTTGRDQQLGEIDTKAMKLGELSATKNSVTVASPKSGIKYAIYDGDKEVAVVEAKDNDGKDIVFNNLFPSTTYTIKATLAGGEIEVGTIETGADTYGDVTTTATTITVTNPRENTTYVLYKISEGQEKKIQEISVQTELSLVFDDLLPNREYVLKAVISSGQDYTYTAELGTYKTPEDEYGTFSYSVDSIKITSPRANTTYAIYKKGAENDGEEIETIKVTNEGEITFDELLPNTEYVIKATVSSTKLQETYVKDLGTQKTLADNYGTFTAGKTTVTIKTPKAGVKYILYNGTEKVGEKTAAADGSDLVFEELLKGTTYTIKVEIPYKGATAVVEAGEVTTSSGGSGGSGGGGGGASSTSYKITAKAGIGGTISPSGEKSVSKGNNVTYTIKAENGYKIADVKVDGTSVGAVASYTFEKVAVSHTIEVTFAKDGAEVPPVDQPTEVKGVTAPTETGVANTLETTKHDGYLSGYENGTFGASNQLTRAEAAQIFYNLLLDKAAAEDVSFNDVDKDAWYAKAVNKLASMGIISGVGDNKFAPEKLITRAEFAAIATRFAKANTEGSLTFTDIPEDAWYYNAVLTAVNYGWINGYSDGTFKPNSTVTRAEVTVIVNNMLGRKTDKAYVDENESTLKGFKDVDKSFWAYYQIMEAANGHSHEFDDDGNESWN